MLPRHNIYNNFIRAEGEHVQQLESLLRQTEGITCHSQEVSPGYIFVAINGRSVDGNMFAASAMRQGALAIVTDCPHNLPDLAIPVITVPDARQALSRLAADFYKHPSHDLALVGVTGTNGKTTITYMLDYIFRTAGLKTGLIGTIKTSIGDRSFPSSLTTPDAVKVQQYLAQMRQTGVTHAAMEVSAQGIEMHRVDHVRFSCGIMSNISPDHLDFHGNFAGYVSAKRQFLDLLGPTSPLIINIGDPYCRNLLDQCPGPVYSAAVAAPADIYASDLALTAWTSSFHLAIARPLPLLNGGIIPTGRFLVHLPLPGRHNVENALLAAAAALLHGIAPQTICQALAAFHGVERRMDISQLPGLTILDDTALNPGSINAVFDALHAFHRRQLIVVNAIRGRRGPAINAANAAVFAHWQRCYPHLLVVTASIGNVGPSDVVTTEEQMAFVDTLRQQGANYIYTDTLPAALGYALGHINTGDMIALLGAQGMDQGRELLTSLWQQAAYHPELAHLAMTTI